LSISPERPPEDPWETVIRKIFEGRTYAWRKIIEDSDPCYHVECGERRAFPGHDFGLRIARCPQNDKGSA